MFHFQISHEEFGEFSTKHSKAQKFYFDELFLSRVYPVWAKEYRGVIFHDTKQWCKIWINPGLVVSKMAWAIGWTSITVLKSLMGSFCQKRVMFQLENFDWILLFKPNKDLDEKIKKSYVSSHWKVMQSLKKNKLIFGSKEDIRTLVNFDPTTLKSKNLTSMGYFCPKYVRFELSKYRVVIFHDTEHWCKICINLDHGVSEMTWGIGEPPLEDPKSEKLFKSVLCFS